MARVRFHPQGTSSGGAGHGTGSVLTTRFPNNDESVRTKIGFNFLKSVDQFLDIHGWLVGGVVCRPHTSAVKK